MPKPVGTLSHVDPFIAVNLHGNCLCGPYLPYSLVRLSPDTLFPQSTSGYQSAHPIVHFSHTHVSGTGGGGRYGNIAVKPFVGPPRVSLDAYEREDERAAPGYYAVTLLPAGVRVELTSTPRTGIHRYLFSAGVEANLLLDVGAAIQVAWSEGGKLHGASHGDCMAISIGGYVEFISETELVGRGDYQGGWGHQFPYSVYFYAKVDRPAATRWVANHDGVLGRTVATGRGCKAVLGFGATREVNLQVGISYVSVAKARASVTREAGQKTFAEIRAKSETIWDKSLARIRVEGGSADEKKLFYTLFTRLLCMPTDLGVDDEFNCWHSGARQFTDIYCLWDSVRNANSLLSLFDPEMEAALLNCLLDVADHLGWIPDAWITGHSAMIQGGSSADILFCEAALKGLRGIDYERALRQMRKNNEVESPDPWLYGRHLKDYRDLGFVSTRVGGSVSRHLEYAYQDWCCGKLAETLGQRELARKSFESSKKIWNLWRDDLKCFAPKTPDGNWVEPFDPTRWNEHFYEGSSRQWSFSAHHDFAGLIARHGGPEAFVRHLDEYFARGFHHSKETILHVPYLYLYAGRPDKTAERVRECLAKYFRPTRDGLSDNEDMGCQSAFYMCSALGIYPVMGQDLYLLTTPIFTRAEIALGRTGRSLVIEAPGAGSREPYIAGAMLNGKKLERAWLRHSEIAKGAVLRLDLSAKPNAWGTQQVPPSPLSEVAD